MALHERGKARQRLCLFVDVHGEILAEHGRLLGEHVRHGGGDGATLRVRRPLGTLLGTLFGTFIVHRLSFERHHHQVRDGRGFGERAAPGRAEASDDPLVKQLASQRPRANRVQFRAVLKQPHRGGDVRGTHQRETSHHARQTFVRVGHDLAPKFAHGTQSGRLPVRDGIGRGGGGDLLLLLRPTRRTLTGRASLFPRPATRLVRPFRVVVPAARRRLRVWGEVRVQASRRQPGVRAHQLMIPANLIARRGLWLFRRFFALSVLLVFLSGTSRTGQQRLRRRRWIPPRGGVRVRRVVRDDFAARASHDERSRVVRLQKFRLDRFPDGLHDIVLSQEVHLAFGGMHVDVHRLRWEPQRREREGTLRLGKYGGVRRLDGAFERRALHQTIVDEQHERRAFGVVPGCGNQHLRVASRRVRIRRRRRRRAASRRSDTRFAAFFAALFAAHFAAHEKVDAGELARNVGAVYGAYAFDTVGRDGAVERGSRVAEFPTRE